MLILVTKFILHLVLPRNFAATGEILPLQLADGPFQTSYYCGPQTPKGIVILGTGDGGWSYWEENTAKHLSAKGYAVGGWDCRKFADSRVYDQTQLAAGFRAVADAVRKRSGADEDAPVWYGGWSTGAEQAVAAASAERAPYLRGLLLAAPGSRGRYGITTSDLLGKEPVGRNTFALAELAPKLGGLRVAQFAAGLDPIDDVNWLGKVSAPHRIFALPGKLHDMGGAGPEFMNKLDEAIEWTLQSTQ
jgi:pimeloyl-ACP methyl ester carboxylesterase